LDTEVQIISCYALFRCFGVQKLDILEPEAIIRDQGTPNAIHNRQALHGILLRNCSLSFNTKEHNGCHEGSQSTF